MKKDYTKEEVANYYNGMREKWNEAKKLSLEIDVLTQSDIAKVQAVLPTMSATGYMFCKMQMKTLGFNGLPGLDCKTFKGWKDCGFKVKKGQKSRMFGITWVPYDKDDGEKGGMYPKVYHLFHTSQVEENK